MSHPKDTGKGGLTELPKFRTQSRPQWESNPAGKKSAQQNETPDSEGVTSANHSKRKRDEQEDLKRVLKGNCFAELHA